MNRQAQAIGTDIEEAPIQFANGSADADFLREYDRVLFGLGDKNSPTKLPMGQYHVDGGMFVEYAPNVARNYTELLERIYTMRTHLEAITGLTLHGYDFVDVDPLPLEHAPFIQAGMTVMGCAKDMCEGEIRYVTDAVRNSPFRESGFHIHVNLPERVTDTFYTGFDADGIPIMKETDGYGQGYVDTLTEALDVFHTDTRGMFDPWYRVRGTYRLKPYGVEYRSLGASIVNDQGRLASVLQMVSRATRDFWRTHA